MRHSSIRNAVKRYLWSGLGVSLALLSTAYAQTVTPPSISLGSTSPVCTGGSSIQEACITLPPSAVTDRVDVFLLFDDTGSFASFVPTVTSIFSSLVSALETALPGVEFGFGVGRFEDYGGIGNSFSDEFSTGRPFTLNQPIVTAADAGSTAARDALIAAALGRTAPGFGGDGPESAIEALFQVATGTGFDGDGNGLTSDSGAAGAVSTQTAPGTSGDVPAFTPLAVGVVSSGAVGGAGFRAPALKIVILATDICPVSPFDPPTIPSSVTGVAGSEPTSAFSCAGAGRFGFVSNAKSTSGNIVTGAIAPSESATLPETIAALGAAGIRVIGMGPGAAPTTSTSPSNNESVFLSALARITGAVDGGGNPLVFSTAVPLTTLQNAIVAAISTTTTLPIDINLMTSGTVPGGLTVSIDPAVVPSVAPGGEACFDVTFTGSGSPSGTFDLAFKDDITGFVLSTIPVEATCISSTELCDVNSDGQIDNVDINLIFAARGTPASPRDPRDANADGRITVNDSRACVLRCTNRRCAP